MPGWRPPPRTGPPRPPNDLENIAGAIITCFVATGLLSWSLVDFIKAGEGPFRWFGVPFIGFFAFGTVGATRQMILILSNYFRWRREKSLIPSPDDND